MMAVMMLKDMLCQNHDVWHISSAKKGEHFDESDVSDKSENLPCANDDAEYEAVAK